MKDTLWKLFEETGNTGYYMLYRELSEDGGGKTQENKKEE